MSSDRVRDEAERLVSAAIAAISLASRGLGASGRGPQVATGSVECCICPVCRLIAAMRDPSADLAERLSSGAGDLATAIASLLRGLSRAAGPAESREDERTREGDEFWESLRRRAAAEAQAYGAGAHRAGVQAAPASPAAPTAEPAQRATSTEPAQRATSAERAKKAPPVTAAKKAAAAAGAKKAAPAKAVKKTTSAQAATKAASTRAAKKVVPPPREFG